MACVPEGGTEVTEILWSERVASGWARCRAGGTIGAMTPEQALLRVIHCLDRAHESGFKAKAFARALDVVRSTPSRRARRASRRPARSTDLDGIGSSTAAVITDALAGREPAYLAKIEAESQVPITPEGQVVPRRAARRLPPPLDLE